MTMRQYIAWSMVVPAMVVMFIFAMAFVITGGVATLPLVIGLTLMPVAWYLDREVS